jgi:hypothetical protein
VLQEVNAEGSLLWQWRASEHIAAGESTHPVAWKIEGQTVYDIYHCNSVDHDASNNSVLLSSRHTDAVYLIDMASGKVQWKLGGVASNLDGAEILQTRNDPEKAFLAQHDARFEPNGGISLYDDHSWDNSQAARGVEYHLDLQAGTATLDWSYASPDGQNSSATGSFRRLDGGNDNVIGWGSKPPALFTEVDEAGSVLLNAEFVDGESAYRVQKVPAAAMSLEAMRATAGWEPKVAAAPAAPAAPAVKASWGWQQMQLPTLLLLLLVAAGLVGFWLGRHQAKTRQ